MKGVVGGKTGNYIPDDYRERANISSLIPEWDGGHRIGGISGLLVFHFVIDITYEIPVWFQSLDNSSFDSLFSPFSIKHLPRPQVSRIFPCKCVFNLVLYCDLNTPRVFAVVIQFKRDIQEFQTPKVIVGLKRGGFFLLDRE